MSIRTSLVAATTAAAVVLSAAPAFAASIRDSQDLIPVNDSSKKTFTIGLYYNEDGKTVDHRVVKEGSFTDIDEFERSTATVCDSQTPGNNDFMWTDKCTPKSALDVIKEITAYILGIVAAIGAVVNLYTTLQKFAV
ncbi:MAG: hypothetical protein SPI77_06605 [Corynebacterium sp.]|nr:hypothetical protein [Corynebacterium sp.]